MKVTDVAIQLAPQGQDRLRGFCCITLDGCFVVRDIKIINGPNGLFVAMPSRKIMASCPRLPHQEPPPRPLLQPVRRLLAGHGPHRRACEDALRRGASHQRGVPPEHRKRNPRGLWRGTAQGRATRLRGTHDRRWRRNTRAQRIGPQRGALNPVVRGGMRISPLLFPAKGTAVFCGMSMPPGFLLPPSPAARTNHNCNLPIRLTASSRRLTSTVRDMRR